MKAKRFLDLAAASRSLLFAWATRALVVLGLLLLPFMVGPGVDFTSGSFAYAEKPPGVGGGKPDPSPGSGGQGKPDEPPGGGGGKPDKPGRGSGDIYSELVIAYRTEEGLPIYVGVPEGFEEDEEVEALALPGGYVACVQPIMDKVEASEGDFLDEYAAAALDLSSALTSPYDPLGNPLINPADGREVSPVPLGGLGWLGEECDVATTGDTPEDYDPPEDYNLYVEEVHFGRMNSGRSPTKVLDSQLAEAYVTLTTQGDNINIDRDHAGRITVDDPATPETPDKTIDSPLQNLAIYRELLAHGGLQLQFGVSLPWNWDGMDAGFLDYAAAALGASAEKDDYWVDGPINLDLVVYFNRILGSPGPSLDAIQGDGAIGADGEYYFDYSYDNTGFSYTRSAKYPGCAWGYEIVGSSLEPFNEPIMSLVFGTLAEPNGVDFSGDNIFAFATAADDSRRVIAFAHDVEDYIVEGIDKAGDDDGCSP